MITSGLSGFQLVLGILLGVLIILIYNRVFKKKPEPKNAQEQEKQRMIRDLVILRKQLGRLMNWYRATKTVYLFESYEELVKQQFYLNQVIIYLTDQAYGIYHYPEYTEIMDQYYKLNLKAHMDKQSRGTYNPREVDPAPIPDADTELTKLKADVELNREIINDWEQKTMMEPKPRPKQSTRAQMYEAWIMENTKESGDPKPASTGGPEENKETKSFNMPIQAAEADKQLLEEIREWKYGRMAGPQSPQQIPRPEETKKDNL